MGNVNFEPDLSGFNNLFPTFEDLAESIRQLSDAILATYGMPTPPIPDTVKDLMQQVSIDMNLWDEVDFDRLTPEQRWEYQKWVWGAPGRWVRQVLRDDDEF